MLLREIGRGAIGVVYAAYHEGLDRKIAIKVLNRQRAGRADLEARLRREARALAKLSHPNVVHVYDVGDFDGRVFVAMEFVEGEALSDWMRPRRPVDEVVTMFAAAARGLAAAHASGVVHRDFKPDNVLVGTDGRPRVLDFGLARAVGAEPEEPASESAVGISHLGALEALTNEAGSKTSKSALRDPSPGATLDGDREDPPPSGASSPAARRARIQALPSKDEGDPHLNEHTRDTSVPAPVSDDAPAPDSCERSGPQSVYDTAPPASDAHQVETHFELDPELQVTVLSQIERGSAAADDVLTRTGAMMGTPAYMSPEQFLGQRVDQASDQFSFCVALYQALYGQRPFSGKTPLELAVAVQGGQISDPPPDTEVPGWLRQVILRGLSPAREDRWPSMDELIAALERDPAQGRRRRWMTALAIGGLAVLAGVVGVAWPSEQDPCPSVDESLAAVWTEGRAGELEAAFERSQLPYANAAWLGVESRLEAWTGQWANQRVDACEATHLRQEFSSEVLDRRQACLERQRRAYEALMTQYAEADRTVVEHAVEAAAALPDPERCGDVDALLAGAVEPSADVAEEVAELRDQLAELDTQRTTGRWQAGLPLARDTVERARQTGFGPVLAEALLTHGRFLAESGSAAAVDRFQAALDEAERSGHDELIPVVATELVSISIYTKPDPIRGRLWARRAMTGLERIDERGHARARGIWALGNLERLDGENERAEQHLREAIDLLDAQAPGHPDRAVMLNDLGNTLWAKGDRASARETYEQALAEAIRAFGEGHPRVAHAHYNLARLSREAGELEEAREQADRALALYIGAHGPKHRDVGAVEILRASIELFDGDLDAARNHATRARDIYDASLASDNIDRAEPHQMLGNVAHAAAQYEQAIVHYRAALTIKRAALPPGHIELVHTLTNIGLVYLMLERADAAVTEHEEALALLEASEGVDPEFLQSTRLYLGDALLLRARPSDFGRAAALFEATREGCELSPELCALIQLRCAQAWARAGDRERARARAREARAALAGLEGQDELLAEAEALLPSRDEGGAVADPAPARTQPD